MAKVKIKGLKDVLKNVRLIFDDSIGKAGFLKEIKDFSVLRIQAETRRGKDLTREGAKQPALSPGYIKFRRRLKAGKAKIKLATSPFFSPGRSNLTLTGKLLDSLRGQVFPRKHEVLIHVTENRTDGENNKDIVSDLKKRGRTFLGMDNKGISLIRKKVLDQIRRQIKQKGFA